MAVVVEGTEALVLVVDMDSESLCDLLNRKVAELLKFEVGHDGGGFKPRR